MKTGAPDAICKVVKAHRNRSAAATLGYIWRADKCKAKFGSLELGGITENIQVDAEALSSGHQGRGEVVKHIVLSMRCAWSKKAENALFRMCHEWIEKFAPGRDWIAGVHVKEDNIHCHIAVRNSGPNGRCLKFKKRDVYEMVQMAWTDIATPSKGVVAEKTLSFAKSNIHSGLDGRDTFEAVRQWAERQVNLGAFQVGRRDKAGRLTSIVENGVRHRLKSLGRAIAELGKERLRDENRARQLHPIEPTVEITTLFSTPSTLAVPTPKLKVVSSGPKIVESEAAESVLAMISRRKRKQKRKIKKKKRPRL